MKSREERTICFSDVAAPQFSMPSRSQSGLPKEYFSLQFARRCVLLGPETKGKTLTADLEVIKGVAQPAT